MIGHTESGEKPLCSDRFFFGLVAFQSCYSVRHFPVLHFPLLLVCPSLKHPVLASLPVYRPHVTYNY